MKAELEADVDRLNALAEARKGEYASNAPFPHILLDDFVRSDILDNAIGEITRIPASEWVVYDDDRFHRKSACNAMLAMGPTTRALIHFLNGQEVTTFLEKLTGIVGLIPDPYLAGGGVHEMRDGGFLNIHADFNVHRHLRLDRRVNLLLYLNRNWKEEYGGNLELWDTDMTACVRRYPPIFNRCVIFNTTDRSFHGNPQPVRTPDGRVRRSIAMYYYSNGRPKSEVSDEHMSLYQYRPGEGSAIDRGRRVLKRFVPPILAEILARK